MNVFKNLSICLGLLLLTMLNAHAFEVSPVSAETGTEDNWSIHGQLTFVEQWHPSFNAPYTGANSLSPKSNSGETFDATLFLGRKLWNGAELYINPEIDQGFGLSDTLGLAGFSSGEAYKVGAADPYYRMPRAFIRQTFNLGGENIVLENAANQVGKAITSNNVIVTLGKFGVVDIFDTNTYAHDARGDFLNWSSLDAGAFDYAADAWGFTYGSAVEWSQDWWTLRSGLFALSTVPNNTNIDLSFQQYEWVGEFEERHDFLGHPGKLKVLGFVNRGYMGSYSDAINAANGSTPDTALVRKLAYRPGIAMNFEQEIKPGFGIFARASINDGTQEAFEFSEINQSVSAGFSLQGDLWQRNQDTLGFVQIVNGLSADARAYFALGGIGILIGDGALNYAPERISEAYYNYALMPHIKLGINYQYVVNPAYNQDRGPVNIFAFRIHGEF